VSSHPWLQFHWILRVYAPLLLPHAAGATTTYRHLPKTRRHSKHCRTTTPLTPPRRAFARVTSRPPSPGPVDSPHFHGTVGEDLPVHAPLVSMWQPRHCGWLEGSDCFGRAHGVACWPGLVRPPRSWARPPHSPQPAASDFWPACAVGCRSLRLCSLGLV
jgi:hypothetical protein